MKIIMKIEKTTTIGEILEKAPEKAAENRYEP